MKRAGTWAIGVALATWAGQVQAGDTLAVMTTQVDPPTLIHLGVQVQISDDDDRDATISVRWREVGGAWKDGPPLVRVRHELVTGLTVVPQFAGSVFGLRPGTDHEIELHAVDPDGLDETWTVMGKTRPVPPAEPANAKAVAVSDTASLKAALAAAAPGDVITLADGSYTGPFEVSSSGTAADPIVIRGTSTAGTLLGGDGCDSCNVIEVYGSFVHIERLTIGAANRALRFQSAGAEGNVVRRVKIDDVRLGIGAREDQKNFYICDNELAGRLVWPQVYADDGGQLANEDGIVVMGDGHVVCHNRLVGFGDSIKTEQDGARGIDIYGNLTLSSYDNAIELDGSAGNTRAVGNMLVNSWSPLSFQPIFGGPAYALRNVVVNIVDEQHKLHSNLNSGETVGAVIVHNTFVSPRHAINLQAEATAHAFALINNLYVGPVMPEGGKVVDWSVPIDAGEIDNNGYFPDGLFDFGGADKWQGFAAMMAAGKFEGSGVLLGANTFASGLVGPADYKPVVSDPDVTLAAASPAVDAARVLPGLNDGFLGAGPDIGALELGCAAPIYGVRPEGVDEASEPVGCGDEGGETDTSGETGDETGDSSVSMSDSASEAGDTATSEPPPTTGATGDVTAGEPTGTGGATGVTDGPTGGTGIGTETGNEENGEGGCGCRNDTSAASLLALLLLAPRRRRPRRSR